MYPLSQVFQLFNVVKAAVRRSARDQLTTTVSQLVSDVVALLFRPGTLSGPSSLHVDGVWHKRRPSKRGNPLTFPPFG